MFPRFHLTALLPLLALATSVGLLVLAYVHAVVPLWDKITPRDLALERNNPRRRIPVQNPLDLLDDGGSSSALDEDFFWLSQVSDLHISSFYDPARTSDFGQLCGSLLASAGAVAPVAVLVTGDLTDGKEKNFYGSTQLPNEWYKYKTLVDTCKDLTPTTTWLDIRGNHDAFDVEKTNSLYLRNSVRDSEAKIGSYSETVQLPGGRTLALVSVDATPKPGLKRPFNFFGSLPEEEVLKLELLLNKTADFTLTFGHYPTSVINAVSAKDPTRYLRDMLASTEPGIYLCGHLHNFLGLAPSMYSRHLSGLLELELADWKDNRYFRVLAFDGDGTFSFTDHQFDPEKINTAVTVLHPKDQLFMLESESLVLQRKKKSVRVFIVSDGSVKAVQAKYDYEPDTHYRNMTASEHAKGIYTLPFNPSRFSGGTHTLSIKVTHSDNSEVESLSSFSLDGSHRPFATFPALVIMADWLPFMMGVFASIALAIAACLAFLRIAHHCKGCSANPRMRINRLLPWFYQWVFGVLRKLWILCSLNSFFWPLMGFVLYVCFGPWAIARVMTSKFAFIFVWGVVFLEDWSYLPPDMAFAYGIITLLLFLTPLIIVLSNRVSQRYQDLFPPPPEPVGRFSRPAPLVPEESNDEEGGLFACRLCKFHWIFFPWRHLGIIVILLIAIANARELFYSYGLICAMSPWGLGRIMFAWLLYRKSLRLERDDFYDVLEVWSPVP